jgi:hypothetical protein
MSVLTAAPFNLAFEHLVSARVRSVNFYGTSDWNTFNTQGALIRQVPTKMGPISVLDKTETMISLAWSPLEDVHTGNAAITNYTLYWDDNTASIDIVLAKGVSTLDYIVYGTTGGLEYQFHVTASNIYGEGEASDILT